MLPTFLLLEKINKIVKPNIKFVEVVIYKERLTKKEIEKFELFDLEDYKEEIIAKSPKRNEKHT